MIIVSDTSPLNYLVLIGEAELLPRLFGRDRTTQNSDAWHRRAVHRWEVFEAIRAQNIAAATSQILPPEILTKFTK